MVQWGSADGIVACYDENRSVLMMFGACLSQIGSGAPELWPPEVTLLGQKK